MPKPRCPAILVLQSLGQVINTPCTPPPQQCFWVWMISLSMMVNSLDHHGSTQHLDSIWSNQSGCFCEEFPNKAKPHPHCEIKDRLF